MWCMVFMCPMAAAPRLGRTDEVREHSPVRKGFRVCGIYYRSCFWCSRVRHCNLPPSPSSQYLIPFPFPLRLFFSFSFFDCGWCILDEYTFRASLKVDGCCPPTSGPPPSIPFSLSKTAPVPVSGSSSLLAGDKKQITSSSSWNSHTDD